MTFRQEEIRRRKQCPACRLKGKISLSNNKTTSSLLATYIYVVLLSFFFSRWHTTHTLISLHFTRWTVQQTIWFQLAFTWFFTLYGHVCVVQGVYVKSFTLRIFSQSFDLSKLYIALVFSILSFYKTHVKQRSMNRFLEPLEPSIFVSNAVKQ